VSQNESRCTLLTHKSDYGGECVYWLWCGVFMGGGGQEGGVGRRVKQGVDTRLLY
jgi:hypothetical protein